jgi:6-pyruvoyltetrahydropterin/6-carboxytetrahydropterin synthase
MVRKVYKLRVQSHFDAAHHLEGYDGKCSRLHGHRWYYEITVQDEVLDSLNMLVDFGRVKAIMKVVEDSYLDHQNLNETLLEKCPTAEYIAKWIYSRVSKAILLLEVQLVSVRVWESPECSVEYLE